jgi:hypothetical protein
VEGNKEDEIKSVSIKGKFSRIRINGRKGRERERILTEISCSFDRI